MRVSLSGGVVLLSYTPTSTGPLAAALGVVAESDAVDDERPTQQADQLAAVPDAVGSAQVKGVLEGASLVFVDSCLKAGWWTTGLDYDPS